MTPSAHATRRVWTHHPGYVMAWTVNVLLACGLGSSALMAEPSRFESPTYDGLRDSLGVPGWGAALAVYAVALVLGAVTSTRLMIGVFAAGAVAYLTVGVYFAVGLPDEHASPWGPWVFLGLGAWQLTQGEAYRQSLRDSAGDSRRT